MAGPAPPGSGALPRPGSSSGMYQGPSSGRSDDQVGRPPWHTRSAIDYSHGGSWVMDGPGALEQSFPPMPEEGLQNVRTMNSCRPSPLLFCHALHARFRA